MKIALAGNPNSGKTSLFNYLTGMNQKVGNYPGITVDKKTGSFKDAGSNVHEVIDLPGVYSVYPKTRDEEIVWDILSNKKHPDYPDLVIVTVDTTNLERNLLLFTQIHDLGIPTILALNMSDMLQKQGLTINYDKLSEMLGGITYVPISARSGEGMDLLKKTIAEHSFSNHKPAFLSDEFKEADTRSIPQGTDQQAFVHARFKKIRQMLGFVVKKDVSQKLVQRHRNVDKILTHPVYGYLIFVGLLALIFQAIYAWAEWPMNLIDTVFLSLSRLAKAQLPAGVFTDLLAEGIIPGLGGVVIFIPQIALLFAFIFIMEETGYMARVVFIMDRLMRPFGLNGRSVVPLISGVACAIPAIMATRTIDNWKERLITIMVTPLMSCSARLPVYTLLIALVIPDQEWLFFNLKGLTLLGLYLLGLIAALLAALAFRFIIRSGQQSFLVMELPLYKAPRWRNLFITIYEKIRIFVFEAGRVILAISIILWVLASYGPGNAMQEAVDKVEKPQMAAQRLEYDKKVATEKLEHSYIGYMGRSIEPVIEPLGYNWQIGISLITSFAAREVFVGSMATIYSVGQDFEENNTLLERMRQAENRKTGEKLYSLASGLSLMIFYAFALQCMSTIAITYRETKSWRWPVIQFVYMTGLAYVSAWIVYQMLS